MATILRDGQSPRLSRHRLSQLVALLNRGPCRVIDYFVTVMVIFFEMTGGLCGT